MNLSSKKYIFKVTILFLVTVLLVGIYLYKDKQDKKELDKHSEDYYKNAEIFLFELSDDSSYYTITGIREKHKQDASIYVPDTIEDIPVRKMIDTINKNFDDWKNIRIIHIGKNIEYIGTSKEDEGILQKGTLGDSFITAYPCLNAVIEVDENNLVYSSLDGILYNKDKTTLIRYPSNKTDQSSMLTFNVPIFVENIYDKAFYNNKGIEILNCDENLKTIGISAFENCSNLRNVSFNSSLISIGNGAFRQTKLVSVTLEMGLLKIGSNAFSYIDTLKEIFIPTSCTEFGTNLFTGHSSSFTVFTTLDNVDTLKSIEAFKRLLVKAIEEE